MRKLLRSQSGTAVVEFALVAPVLIFLMIGLIEVGRYLYFGIMAAHAAETGAQYASQSLTNAQNGNGISSAVTSDSPGVTWVVTPNWVCYSNGNSVNCPALNSSSSITRYIQITVNANFQSLLNYPGIPNNIPISASTTMRVLGQ